jgi:hypothetical protein
MIVGAKLLDMQYLMAYVEEREKIIASERKRR